jgi:uracil-DNA glycosylase
MFTALARFRSQNVFNPWGGLDPLDCARHATAQRLRRLKQHFDCEAAFVLVGEAPGYQGCRFSGVPFTSERLLLEGRIPRVTCTGRFTRRARPWSEPSATIVWQALHELGIAERVVLWNAFPWHPHRQHEPHSNRRPSDVEARRGADVLRAVLARFEGATVVAVGQVARQALHDLLDLESPVIRHPANGGAKAFATGLAAIVRRRLNRY